jgi:hypothetical protein
MERYSVSLNLLKRIFVLAIGFFSRIYLISKVYWDTKCYLYIMSIKSQKGLMPVPVAKNTSYPGSISCRLNPLPLGLLITKFLL